MTFPMPKYIRAAGARAQGAQGHKAPLSNMIDVGLTSADGIARFPRAAKLAL